MSFFRSISFSQRLYFLSGALILALTLVTANTWVALNNVRDLTVRTGKVKVLQLSLIASTELKVTQALSDIRHAMLSKVPGAVDEAERQVQLKRQQISKNDADFLAEITEQSGRDAFKRDWLDLQAVSWPVAEKNFELIRKGDNEAALKMLTETTVPQFEKIQKWLSEERDRQTQYLSQDVATIGADVEAVRLRLTLLVSAVAICLVVVSLMITRALKARIASAQGIATRVSQGDFSQPVRDDGKDEFSALLGSLSAMQASLTDVVAQVRANAEGVATASTEIARGNQDLSQRTEEQASALEQSSATMSELGTTVRNNADSSKQANVLAQSASSVALQGGEMVGKVIDAMQSISASSRTINDIIGVIDGIAFQTNILALNAAVEAARAGEQGRGFAVVAGEVRTLARRSADAAKEIKSLINRSVEQVEVGSELVAQTGKTMDEIVDSIRRVSDIVGEITSASVEQTTAIQQVGDAVSQLDKVTQQNAALVEESAAAAETLKGQAQSLVHAVAVFKLAGCTRTDHAAPPPAAPAPQAQRSSPRAAEAPPTEQDWATF